VAEHEKGESRICVKMWNMPASEDKASKASRGVTIAANSRMEMGECNEPSFSKPKSETVMTQVFQSQTQWIFFFYVYILAMTFCELVIMFLPYHGIIGIQFS